MPRQRKGLPIHGILLLDKPYGLSSNKALQQAKFLYKAQKAGHTGSLDPLATGMLPICFGEATKVCAHLLDASKAYRAEITLGVKTSTDDGEGEVVHEQAIPNFSSCEIETVLEQFRGDIEQIPPMHSALWHEGKRLYQLARQGKVVDIKPRQVNIGYLQVVKPLEARRLIVDVHCSKGTYIRSLARDIGEQLGCGAYMSALHRTYVEPFQQQAMHDYEQLERMNNEALIESLLPIDSALQHYPALMLDHEQAEAVIQGRKIQLTISQQQEPIDFSLPQVVRIYRDQQTSQQFLGLANSEGLGVISPKRLMQQ